MSIVIAVADWSILAFYALFFVAQTLVREGGYALGRHHAATAEQEGVGVLVGAMLALMAFVLALTLSFANTRYDERRAGTLAEANAIGTAWLRAEAIDDPRAADIARLLKAYAEARVSFVEAPRGGGVVDAANQKTSDLQNAIWGDFAVLSRGRSDPIVAGLMNALNEMFDTGTAERFAFSFAMPAVLFWLISGMALLTMAALGFQLGIRGNAHRALATLLTATWTLVIVGILDLGAPRLGAIRTDTTIYDWTIQSFEGGLHIPKLPGG